MLETLIVSGLTVGRTLGAEREQIVCGLCRNLGNRDTSCGDYAEYR